MMLYASGVNRNNLTPYFTNVAQGVHNSRLIRSYGTVDERFFKLGFMVGGVHLFWRGCEPTPGRQQVKHWAKRCDVNDGSNMTLSSYALTLMLLHYLQNTTPPVLPYLQQVRRVNVGAGAGFHGSSPPRAD